MRIAIDLEDALRRLVGGKKYCRGCGATMRHDGYDGLMVRGFCEMCCMRAIESDGVAYDSTLVRASRRPRRPALSRGNLP